MRLFTVLCLVMSLTIQMSLATEKDCLTLLTQFNDADEYRFLKNIKGFNSTLAPEIKALMENEETSNDFFIKVLHLKNMHKAMKEAFAGDNDAAKITNANRFVETVSSLLSGFNVEHTVLEEEGVKHIKFHKEGHNRIAMLIRRMSGEATAEVYYHPYAVHKVGAAAMYASGLDRLFLSNESIIKFNFKGELEGLLKPSASEFHEFLHARFEAQRASGIDHALNTYLYPKEGYLKTGYENFMAMEELAVYLNQLNDFSARIAYYERTYDSTEWLKFRRGLLSILYPAHYFEDTIRPMAINIRSYAMRMKESLTAGETPIEVNRPHRQVINIKTTLGEGTFIIKSENVMEFHFLSEHEGSKTYFYDKNLINTMFRSNRTQDAAEAVLAALLERSENQIAYANRAIGLASKFRKYQRALDRAILNGNPHRIRTEFEKIRRFLTASRNLLLE